MGLHRISEASTVHRQPPAAAWTQTKPSEAAWTTDMNTISGGIAGHSHQHGPWWQYGPPTSTWPQDP